MSAESDRRSLVLRGVLDLCFLALLRDGPVYGYELTDRLNDHGLTVGNGTAYPLLARMQRLGLVEVREQPSPTGPPRKYYSLSVAGKSALERGRSEWLTTTAAVSTLLSAEPVLQNRTASKGKNR